jgi:hypothetical protein
MKKNRISATAIAEIETALRDYTNEVLQAGLGEMSTNMYIDKADYFVRWLKGEFAPGMRKKSA